MVHKSSARLLGPLFYVGTWNALTNDPTLVSSIGTTGAIYVVSVAGTTDLNGITDWQVGDWALFNGSVWEKVDNTSPVASVSNSDGTLTISPTTGAVIASLNLAHANAWTGQQTFGTSSPVFSTMTAGSVLFAGASGILAQDNPNLFWDDTNNRLGIGTNSPNATLEVVTSAFGEARFRNTTANSYTSFRFLNDLNSDGTSTIFGQTGSTSVGIWTSGSSAVSQGFWGTVHAAPITIGSNGIERIFIDGTSTTQATTKVGIGLSGNSSNVTAVLHLRAGSTSIHPFRMNSAALKTSQEIGGWDFLTDKLYFTITTGTARKEIALYDSAMTAGSVFFAGTNGRITQNNANLFWDNNLNSLGIGTNSPSYPLHVKNDVNSTGLIVIENASAGSSASASIAASNGTNVAYFGIRGTGASALGALVANDLQVYRAGDIGIMANSGSGVIKFASGGTAEVGRFDASGRLGIGTASPLARLHVAQDNNIGVPSSGITGSAMMQFYVGGTNTNKRLMFGYDTTNDYGIIGAIDNAVAWKDLYLQPNSANGIPNVVIKAAGNVGIGTGTPGTPLHVKADSSIGSSLFTNSTDYGLYAGAITSGTYGFIQATQYGVGNNVNLALQPIAGKVGVGTATPRAIFEVSGTASEHIRILGGSTQNGMTFDAVAGANEFYLYTGAAFNAGFGIYNVTTGAQAVSILNNGNTGIGITNPTSRLESRFPYAKTDTSLRYALTLGSNETSNASVLNFVSTGASSQVARHWEIQTSEAGVASDGALNLQAYGGKVGIGLTDPQELLHIQSTTYGGIRVNGAGGSGYAYIQLQSDNRNWSAVALPSGDADSGKFTIADDSAGLRRLTIDTSGNTGLGTTSPAYKLDVNGTLHAAARATLTGGFSTPENTENYCGFGYLNGEGGGNFHIFGSGSPANFVGLGSNNILQIGNDYTPIRCYADFNSNSSMTLGGALSVTGNVNISTLTASKLVLTDSSKNLISGTAANLATAGIPTVVASTFEKAETGTDANVLTYTSGGADEFLNVMVATDVSAITGTSIVVTATWKDSNNATATSTLTLTAVGDGTMNLPINCKTATNVIVSTVFVGISTNYIISAFITRFK